MKNLTPDTNNQQRRRKAPVRVRFAPSPTGALHIGGVRTALFNYLFAKKNKGEFLLRIEDTDRERNQKVFEQDIKTGLRWLGIKWDKEYYQSKRTALYKKYLQQLLKQDLAYRQAGAVYFRTPTTGKIVVDDVIRGRVEFDAQDIDDFVIQKSDGGFVFHFVNVIDDWQMNISHVIRGEDHLSNTPKHILLFKALGAEIPKYVHIPLILNADRSKMSKRTGDVNFADYVAKGYLPEALINFLVQLGWSDPKGREFFSLKELIVAFDLSRVQKAGAVFDLKYLNHINHHYLAKLSAAAYYKLAKPFLGAASIKYQVSGRKNMTPDTGRGESLIRSALRLVQDRAEYLAQLPELMSYFYKAPDYDKDLLVFKKSSPEQTVQGLTVAHRVLSAVSAGIWTEKKLQQVLDIATAAEGLSPGDIFWPVRVALSGLPGSPSPVELLSVLGKKESVKRLELALKKLE
jgi:glutamyl-tRNA synthetase